MLLALAVPCGDLNVAYVIVAVAAALVLGAIFGWLIRG